MSITLSPRSESVLKTLIETYLVEGEPVGSRLLSKLMPGSLSSATIRNVLSDLEEDTLVDQPHTSAGRVPTEKAYRYYVDRWVKGAEPDPDLGARLSTAFEGMDDPEREAQWMRHASKVLSEAMQGICVALPTHLSTSRMVRLEFIPIDASKLATWNTRSWPISGASPRRCWWSWATSPPPISPAAPCLRCGTG